MKNTRQQPVSYDRLQDLLHLSLGMADEAGLLVVALHIQMAIERLDPQKESFESSHDAPPATDTH